MVMITTTEVERTPLGVKSRCIVERDRLLDVLGAIYRYVDKYKQVPNQWLEEVNDLLKRGKLEK